MSRSSIPLNLKAMSGKKGQAEKIILAAIALSEAEAKMDAVMLHLRPLLSAAGTDKLLAITNKLENMRYGLEDPVFAYIRRYHGSDAMQKCPLFNVEGVKAALVLIRELEPSTPAEPPTF